MKKNPKKLRLNRDTLAVLAGAVSAPANGFQVAIDTSCGEVCSCPADTCNGDVLANFDALR
ncbi:MAG TPA: hypothetical protein VEL74_00910 [Thermoanaerobaculia bacterium]|nr:hypothetical protein [Thermoanaerobaculia bacterium]